MNEERKEESRMEEVVKDIMQITQEKGYNMSDLVAGLEVAKTSVIIGYLEVFMRK